MKIAVISLENIPSHWAHSINVMKHAQGFYSLNHNVKILTVEGASEIIMRFKAGNVHEFYDINKNIPLIFFLDNPFLFFKKIKFFGVLISRILSFFPFLKRIMQPEMRIIKYCKKDNIELVYCRTFNGAYWTIANKIPTILETHTINTKNPGFQNILKLKNNPFFRGIVTIHDKLKENYVKEGIPSEKVIVLEDAVDITKFNKVKSKQILLRKALNLPLDKKIIMYCGSLKSGKGIGQILEVAKNFQQDVIFSLIGGQKNDIKYWQNIANKKIIKNLNFLGYVPNKYVPYYLKSADILIMLYDRDEYKRIMDIETTSPIKLFEYMASKRPIISSKIPTLEKIIQHEVDALMPDLQDIKAIVKYINELLQNNSLIRKLSINAYEKVKKYTYECRCKQILKMLG